MAGGSTYIQQSLLAWAVNHVTMPASPATIYVSLHTGDPGQIGSSEATGGSYARVAVACNTTNWTAPDANGTTQRVQNGVAVTFPAPTGTWGTCTYFGAWDAATGGNYIAGGALTAAVNPVNGDAAYSFAAGQLSFSVQ